MEQSARLSPFSIPTPQALVLEGERHVPSVRRYSAAMHLGHMASYREALRYAYGRKVLDVGCGTGYGSFFLASYSVNQVEAIDNFVPALDYARQVYAHPRLNFTEGDALELPYPDESFDFVFSSQVIQYIKSSDVFIKEIFRVLRPNGFCLITTPNQFLFNPGENLHENEHLQIIETIFPRVVMRGIPQNCLEILDGSQVPSLKPDSRIDPGDYQVQDNHLDTCENLLLYAHKNPDGVFSSTLPQGLLAASTETAPIFFDPQVGLHLCMGKFPDKTIQYEVIPVQSQGQLFNFRSPMPMLYRVDLDLAELAKINFSIEVTTRSGKRLIYCEYPVGSQAISLVFDAVNKSEDELFYILIKPLSESIRNGIDTGAILVNMMPTDPLGKHKKPEVPVLSTFHQVLPHGS